MERVPRIVGFAEIARVTYYQWMYLGQCPLKGAISFLKLDGPLPRPAPTQAELIGRFHHRAMELAATAETVAELDTQIDAEITRLQATVDQWAHLRRAGSVSGWDPVNRAAALAKRIASTRGTPYPSQAKHAERDLRSKDGRLIGRPDFFSIVASKALLREYKSGPIRQSDGELISSHVEQLRFYSHLIFDNFEIEHVLGRLESMSGDTQEMVIERKEAGDFAARVLELVDSVSAKLAKSQSAASLARPSKTACCTCNARIVCPGFKQEQYRLGLEGEQFVLQGTVKSYKAHASSNVLGIAVAGANGRAIDTLKIPTKDCGDVSVDASYVFMNLRLHGGALAWGHTSRILKSD